MRFYAVLKKPYFFYLLHVLISAALTTCFMWGMRQTQFVFASDEILYLTKYHALNSLFTLQPNDLGVTNAVTLIATFFDRLFYAGTSLLGLSMRNTQVTLYFLKLLLSLILPFVGLAKLRKLYLKKADLSVIFVISLWYTFNPLTLIYWQGNAFALTLLISYSLAPLALYYFHRSVFGQSLWSDKITASLLLFFMSFVLFIPAVFALFAAFYTTLFAVLHKIPWKQVLTRVLQLALLFAPLSMALVIAPYDMVTTANTTVNAVGGETYGSLSGGFLYQLFMWFSWPIYTYWEPRNIFSYYRYYFSLPVMLAPFIIYGMVLYELVRKKSTLVLIFFGLFLFFLFFVKGGQAPFGELYLYLVNETPFFRVFRSPDNKFSFGIILSLAVLLLLASAHIRKRLLVTLILIVIAIQAYPLFTGVAIRGENTSYSSDRILEIPKEYADIASYLNRQSVLGYILTLPKTEIYSHYLVGRNKFIGDDILPKIVRAPFVYISPYSSMSNESYQFLTGKGLEAVRSPSISYVVLRRDVRFQKPSKSETSYLSRYLKPVYTNRLFTVYKNQNAKPLLFAGGAKVVKINPTRYELAFENVGQDETVTLFQNYNSNWNLYESGRGDYQYLFARPLFKSSHRLSDSYANSWTVSSDAIKKSRIPHTINSDGTINFNLTLYFKLQSLFAIGVTIAGLYLLGLLTVLVILHLRPDENSKKK